MPAKALTGVVGLIIIFLHKDALENYMEAAKLREYQEEMFLDTERM